MLHYEEAILNELEHGDQYASAETVNENVFLHVLYRSTADNTQVHASESDETTYQKCPAFRLHRLQRFRDKRRDVMCLLVAVSERLV